MLLQKGCDGMGYDGSLKFDTEINEKGFSEGIGKIGSVAKKGMAVATASVVGLSAAIGSVTKASLDSVASLEQNIGGVETLFKDSADAVIKNANRAYKTAGMSANEYMSTVTSFSASLLQSLDGDTKKATSYADRAIIDMSDNVNKMGTDMQSIQNAYQGFAKQNYTMLDNLKLGYGGTKEEMARLIQDASAMKDVQEKLGITVDESSMSFGNIVNAISVMQESLGIAGTTSEEAATTIEGSVNSAKAAWDNFLNGSGTPEELADSIGVAAGVIAENLGNIIPRLAKTILKAAAGVYEQLGKNVLTSLLSGIQSAYPNIIETGINIVSNIGNGIISSLPLVSEIVFSIITSLLQGIIDNAPTLLSAGADILLNLSQGISEKLPDLVPVALQAVLTLAQSIITNAPKILQAGINIVLALVQGVANSIPMLVAQVPRIINQFWSNFDKCVLKLAAAGVKVITTIAMGIVKSIPTIIANAGQIASAILNTISHLNLLSAGKNIIKTLGNGLKGMNGNIVSIAKQIVNKIKTSFTSINWGEVGKQVINGIKNGIIAAASTLYDSLKTIASNALNAAKNALGIHSPSKVFREQVGKQIVKGIVKGIKDLEGTLTKTASSVSLSAVASAKAAMNQGDLEEAGKSLISSLSDGVNAKSDATDKALQSAINQQIKNVTDKKKYKKYKEQFSEVGKGLIESMSNALSESTTKITEQAQAKIEELSQSYQAAYDEVANKQSSLLSKMSDVSNMYDLDSQIEKISRYQDQLGKLKGRIPESLMDEILGMDVSEANNFTEYLNGLTNEQLSAYIGKWEQIQNTSKNYSDQFFKNELDTIKNSYSREVDNVMLDAKQQMEQAGINVAKGLISGLQSQTKNMSKTAKKIAKQLIKDFKTAFKIKSPSRVMQDEVGSFLPPGITKGFLKKLPDTEKSIIEGISDTVKSVQRRISGLQYSAPAPAMLLAGTNQAPNITVVNSQPVQLNAEIHTDVDLDGRAVGKGVTTYVNQFMNDASNRERRGS